MNPSLFGELLQTIGERGRALARPRLATGTKCAKFLVLNADMVWREIDETPGFAVLQEA